MPVLEKPGTQARPMLPSLLPSPSSGLLYIPLVWGHPHPWAALTTAVSVLLASAPCAWGKDPEARQLLSEFKAQSQDLCSNLMEKPGS